MSRILTLIASFFIVFLLKYFYDLYGQKIVTFSNVSVLPFTSSSPQMPTQLPTKTPQELPDKKLLFTDYHVFQTFNNCGPAALSMALRFYGIQASQQELGDSLRPYQNIEGINDDKSVTLIELGEKSKEYGFLPFLRPNGNIETIKKLISYNMPVIARTWTKADEDIGHFRIIKGYDDSLGIIIQDDSLQGKNLEYSYNDFLILWEKFNYEYLVLVPDHQKENIKYILGEDYDEQVAWQKAVHKSKDLLNNNPNNIYARFNLSIAYFKTGDYQQSVNEYEKIESDLPFRTLWYQIEPVLAYYKTGRYEKVIDISIQVANLQNPSYAEMQYLSALAYNNLGQKILSTQAFSKAASYNTSPYWKSNIKEVIEI